MFKKNIFFLLLFILISSNLFANDISNSGLKFKTFSTIGNEKANGINFEINYPENWISKESNQPHIVKVFKSQDKSVFSHMFMIMIKNIEQTLSNTEVENEIAKMSLSDIQNLVYPQTLLNYEKKQYNGQPGILTYTYYKNEVSNLKFYYINHILFYKNTIITIMCGVGAEESIEQKKLLDEFNKTVPLFISISNTIKYLNTKEIKIFQNNQFSTVRVLAKRWLKNDIGDLDKYSDKALLFWLVIALVFSFLLTWGIGLAEPLIIRYFILKNPMTKKVAIITSVIFLFINLSLFIAIGSRNKQHPVLLIIAFISYFILTKKNKIIKEKDLAQDNTKSVTKDTDCFTNNKVDINTYGNTTKSEKTINNTQNITIEKIKLSNNKWKKLLKQVVFCSVFSLLTLGIIIIISEFMKTRTDIIDIAQILNINNYDEFINFSFLFILFACAFIPNINIKNNLNEFIPFLLAIILIVIDPSDEPKYLELIAISVGSFYFVYLLRYKYKASILFYVFLLLGVLYNPIFKTEIETNDISSILIIIPFFLYRFIYLGKDKNISN